MGRNPQRPYPHHPGSVLFLTIFYAVKFAIMEAHRELNDQAKQAVEGPDKYMT